MDLEYIQDIAGEDFPVAPFAASRRKDILSVRKDVYDDEGHYIQSNFYDYRKSKGRFLDEEITLGSNRGYTKMTYHRDSVGKMWKYVFERGLDGVQNYVDEALWEDGDEFPCVKDLYDNDGFLIKRTLNDNYIEEYKFSNEDKYIYLCIRNKASHYRHIYFEQYNDEGLLLFMSCIKEYEHFTHESFGTDEGLMRSARWNYAFHYEDGRIKQITEMQMDCLESFIFKYVYENFDEKDNWRTCAIERINCQEGNVVNYKEEREIAYNEHAANELREAFNNQMLIAL